MNQLDLLRKMKELGWLSSFEISPRGALRVIWTNEGAACAAAFRLCWLCFQNGDCLAADRFWKWMGGDNIQEIGAMECDELRPILQRDLLQLGDGLGADAWDVFLDICVSHGLPTEGGV